MVGAFGEAGEITTLAPGATILGRLRTNGLGPTYPSDSNDTEAGRQQNRRVELVRID